MSYLADALKEKGNHAFREGDYHAAEDFYTQVSNQHIIISTERVRPKWSQKVISALVVARSFALPYWPPDHLCHPRT